MSNIRNTIRLGPGGYLLQSLPKHRNISFNWQNCNSYTLVFISAVEEECRVFILDSLDLSQMFNCDLYPDSDNSEECVNLGKGKLQ